MGETENPIETLIRLLLTVWPLWVAVVAILLGRFALFVYRERRLARSGIAEIDAMDGRTFEHYLRSAFVRLGYAVEVTKYRGDYGADLVVRKNGRKIAVQVKRYTKRVGVTAVQEAVASKGYYDADAAMVVTNRYYTQQAKTLARKNGVELWDRDRLVSVLIDSQAAQSPSEPALGTPEATAARIDDPPQRCAECGDPVSEKVYAYCRDHPERFGARIYCFRHQRRFPRRGPSAA